MIISDQFTRTNGCAGKSHLRSFWFRAWLGPLQVMALEPALEIRKKLRQQIRKA